jgi:hypothetical protein
MTWIGRHTDSKPEAAMHIGLWLALLALGWTFGAARGTISVWVVGMGAVGLVVAVAGQLACEESP